MREPSLEPVVCVVPTYDAAATVGAVVVGLRAALPAATVIGVDDGSTDDTRSVLDACCDEVVRLPRNRGKGVALRAGFAAACERGAGAVITVDADGQHDPRYATSLLAALAGADLVVGTRQRRRTAMPIHRRLSNALSSAAISWCAGVPLPDTQSGYRAMRREVIDRIDARGDRYEFETEFLIAAARAGFQITGVPVPTLYGAGSHFREVRDAMLVVGTIWRHVPWRSPASRR